MVDFDPFDQLVVPQRSAEVPKLCRRALHAVQVLAFRVGTGELCAHVVGECANCGLAATLTILGLDEVHEKRVDGLSRGQRGVHGGLRNVLCIQPLVFRCVLPGDERGQRDEGGPGHGGAMVG